MRIFYSAKDSHIFPTKNISVFVIFNVYNFNETFILNNWLQTFNFSIVHDHYVTKLSNHIFT